MLEYMKYLGIPAGIILVFVGILFVLQFIELNEKALPGIKKITNHFKQKRKEREALTKLPEFIDKYSEMSETVVEVQGFLKDVKSHYSEDNIAKRDGWMNDVNSKIADLYEKQAERDSIDTMLNEKMDKNNEITLALLIDNKRNYIIGFADKAADGKCPLTKEQFNRFFKVHREYEDIIRENRMTNGEVDIAFRIAEESYEERLRNHSFLEDIRGY